MIGCRSVGRCENAFCGLNEQVISGECVPCLEGQTNAAGDLRSEGNTECDGTICGENEYVFEHRCLPCDDNLGTNAPHDSAGDDTDCVDLSICAMDNGGCDVNATCTPSDIPGDDPICVCNDGYEGDGQTCTDIDECLVKMAAAAPTQRVANAADSGADPICGECLPGYEDDGSGTGDCADINECDANNGGCGANRRCADGDRPGNDPICGECLPGYEDDGSGTGDCVDNTGGDGGEGGHMGGATMECPDNSTCDDSSGSPTCVCSDGSPVDENGDCVDESGGMGGNGGAGGLGGCDTLECPENSFCDVSTGSDLRVQMMALSRTKMASASMRVAAWAGTVVKAVTWAVVTPWNAPTTVPVMIQVGRRPACAVKTFRRTKMASASMRVAAWAGTVVKAVTWAVVTPWNAPTTVPVMIQAGRRPAYAVMMALRWMKMASASMRVAAWAETVVKAVTWAVVTPCDEGGSGSDAYRAVRRLPCVQ